MAAYNAVEAEPQYYAINSAFGSQLVGLFVLSQFGFIDLAGSSTVVLTGVGSFLLISDELTTAFATIPILVASWYTERQEQGIDFWVAFSDVIIIERRLIREAWDRWESRPSRQP